MKKTTIKKNTPKKVSQPKKETNKYSQLFGIAVIIFLGIIIYSNSFQCSFHFDDIGNIADNKTIRDLSNVNGWWNFYPNRPIAIFTFALNYHFNQLDLWGYHLVNLIIHLINACLVWWLTLLIFSSPSLKDHKIAQHKKWIALLTALLFVSHPLATQSVTYIVQRMASMVAMFYLLSVVLYLKARLSGKGNIFRYVLFALCILAAMLAMLTKENAYTLPFAILLVEFILLRKNAVHINFKDYRLYLFLAIITGIVVFNLLRFSLSIFKPILPAHGHTYTLTASNYLLTQFSVIVKYIQLLFLPVNQMLDYNFPISNNFFGIRTLLSFLFLVAIMISAVLLFKKHRMISFGIFWFFMTLAVESSFIPIEDVIYEHRTYLPSFGFFLIISSTVFLQFWDKYKPVVVAVFTIIILSLSYLTYQRNKVWKNEFTLMNDNVEKAPDFARPLSNRGVEYSKLQQWDKALADYTKAIQINPGFENAFYNRGVAYAHFEQWNNAISDYDRAIAIFPDYSGAYCNRGVVYEKLGQRDKAIDDYSKAIKIFPKYTDAYYNRALAYASSQQWDKAIADYSKAIVIDSNFSSAYTSRGVAYANLSQWDKAIADFTMAIKRNGNNTEAYFNRGNAYALLKQWQKAIDDFDTALRLDPTLTIAKTNRDIAYANLQMGK